MFFSGMSGIHNLLIMFFSGMSGIHNLLIMNTFSIISILWILSGISEFKGN